MFTKSNTTKLSQSKDKTISYELHIARAARNKYELDQPISIDAAASDFQAARVLAKKINAKRDLLLNPENSLDASDLNAINLMDEIMHLAIDTYCDESNHDLFTHMEEFLADQIGANQVDELLEAYADMIPPSDKIYNKAGEAKRYLYEEDDDAPHRHILLEDMLVSWIDNKNPAAKRMKDLFDDTPLAEATVYEKMFRLLPDFFRNEPLDTHTEKPLLQMLLDPIQQHPDSLADQLEYIQNEWGEWMESIMPRLLRSRDFIREEQRIRFDPEIFGPGPSEAPDFSGAGDEPEKFSQDLDWMPNVVLIAKNATVWLDQLSQQYQRHIKTLSDIPDEELAELASRGFNALWLIGIWKRSHASEKIKKMMGNPEAAASAYSLISYRIDDDLGGKAAHRALKEKAEAHGIRLACDMVPNHTGLDSEWICEHPEWFIQCDVPPFPSYKFTGENLSGDDRIQVFMEDGYWNHSDASVVFKYINSQNGETRYIYHGNDGTHLPWNDTAQLNYLMPEVREAVIQEIITLAKQFPIIRFDAAMTLAKKHVQRLWYPEPGSGGDIASRAERGISNEDFEKAFPNEFWREVVERVQQEAPDTLLLAEAFWMMEGYFVRSLGMHRVYNSAFMNMLKNEENAKYRESIRNVLEFEPEILKRYVNFMSNPDEETAIAQFGTDDKYFGVCILMSTMPGTPMFGHGQVEGYGEKYGMEYRRAYHNETPNQHLIDRHTREIAPLLKKRHLFSGAQNFRLYDLVNEHGHANEDVFAYSNRAENESGIIVYNNKFSEAHGRIHRASAFITDNGNLEHTTLTENLNINATPGSYLIFTDQVTQIEYILPTIEIAELGLPIALGAFKYHVFLNFRVEINSPEKPYTELAAHLAGHGAPNIEIALDEWIHHDIIKALKSAIDPEQLKTLKSSPKNEIEQTLIERLTALSTTIANVESIELLPEKSIARIATKYTTAIEQQNNRDASQCSPKLTKEEMPILILMPFVKILRELYKQHNNNILQNDFIKERMLKNTIQNALLELGSTKNNIQNDLNLIKLLACIDQNLNAAISTSTTLYLEYLFSDLDAQHFTGLNKFEQNVYFNKERFEQLINWLTLQAIAEIQSDTNLTEKEKSRRAKQLIKLQTHCTNSAEKAGYQLGNLLKHV